MENYKIYGKWRNDLSDLSGAIARQMVRHPIRRKDLARVVGLLEQAREELLPLSQLDAPFLQMAPDGTLIRTQKV